MICGNRASIRRTVHTTHLFPGCTRCVLLLEIHSCLFLKTRQCKNSLVVRYTSFVTVWIIYKLFPRDEPIFFPLSLSGKQDVFVSWLVGLQQNAAGEEDLHVERWGFSSNLYTRALVQGKQSWTLFQGFVSMSFWSSMATFIANLGLHLLANKG